MIVKPLTAVDFLARFNHDLYTFAAIQESGSDPVEFNLPDFKSSKHGPQNKAKVSAAVSLHEYAQPDFYRQLCKLNKLKRAIYFTPNECDGQADSETPNVNKRRNVISLNACFADTDRCPVQDFVKWIKKYDIHPHIVVESSPDKFHFYFLLEPTPVQEEAKWKAVQMCMGAMGNASVDCGMDRTMHDMPQLLRVPGYAHQKRGPFLINVRKNYNHSPYTVDELFNALPCDPFYYEKKDWTKFEYPDGKVFAGARHEIMRNYALSVCNNNIGHPDIFNRVLDSVDGFMMKKFDKPNTFLLGGNRRREVLRTVSDTINHAKKAVVHAIPDDAFEDAEETAKDTFALPNSFYFNAPGLVGEITRHVCSKARYPIPSFTFASAISLLGTLRAGSVTSNLGHAPSNFFLCLGPTGIGKNYPQEVIINTAAKMGIGKLFTRKIRSSRGIERFLSENNSLGSLSIDESAGFFRSLIDSSAPTHLKQCKELLLELYSSTNIAEVSTGWSGDRKDTPIILKYPRVNVIAYGVVKSLHESFSIDSIQDGLLQRFIVLTHMGNRKMNDNAERAAALNGHIGSALNEILLESNVQSTELMMKLADAEAKLEKEEKQSSREKLQKYIKKINAKINAGPSVIVNFEPAAEKRLIAYAKELDDLANQEIRKEDGLEGLFTRGAEQVGRLCTAVNLEGDITVSNVDYMIEFIQSRIDALSTYVRANLNVSEYTQEKRRLYRKIVRRFKDEQAPIRYRWLTQNYKSRNHKHLRNLVDGLYDAGLLQMIDPPSRGGRGKTGESFIPRPKEEEL